jgi:hypothetical protein
VIVAHSPLTLALTLALTLTLTLTLTLALFPSPCSLPLGFPFLLNALGFVLFLYTSRAKEGRPS